MSDKYPGGFVTANAPAGFSVAFDGTGDYLSGVPSTAYDFGTSENYSVEFWAYLNSVPSSFAFTGGNATGAFGINYDTSGGYLKCGKGGVGNQLTTSYVLQSGQWYHIVFCRQSSTLSAFVNGTRVATTTDSTSYTATAGFIGGDTSFASMNGYLSNFRIVTGSSAYNPSSTTITVPTQLFPITNTALLACQSPTIIDTSGNAVTLTAVGDAKVSNFTPFAAYTGFNPALGAAAGGVWTLDEAAYYQNNRQWPIYDPYFNQTTLMLHGNGTNGAQNNTFLDSSTNNFTITRNGNTTQGTFTPFSQTGWSNYFNGSTDYLSVPSSANLAIGTGDYTLEAWLYMSSTSFSNQCFYGGTSSGGPIFTIRSQTSLVINPYGSGDTCTFTGAYFPANQWYHIAITRQSSTARLFVNGVLASTTTDSGNYGQTVVGVGGIGLYYWTGYVSNLRFIKGSAIYTSSFTPSTAPLTAVTGTQLLTSQSQRFVDNSANNFAITANSAPSVQAFSPFVPAYITPTTYSNWFDGTGDRIDVASNASFGFGTGDFTVEGWLYWTADGSNAPTVFSIGNVNTTGSLNIFVDPTYGFYVRLGTGSDTRSTAAYSMLGKWTYFAVVRTSGVIAIYYNGVSQAVTTSGASSSITATAPVIGWCAASAGNQGYLNGVISNLRVTNTAVYSASFTPPTVPLTAISGTLLLTCQSSTFVDNSGSNRTLTPVGNVQPVTSPTPFPANVDTTTLNSAYSTSLIGGSGYFDGTGDYLSIPANAGFQFDGDFTVECWFYSGSGTTTSKFDQIVGTIVDATTGYWRIGSEFNGGKQFWFTWTTGAYNDILTSFSVSDNAWHHLAVTRISNSVRLFVDGIQRGSTTTVTTNLTASAPLMVMNSTQGSNQTQGYVASLRIIKGQGIYSTAFSPQRTPFTAISGTTVLLNFTNGAIFDNTAKNVLETVGNAQISTTQSKWGGSSMYFDGTGDYLYKPADANLQFGSGNFTIECWIYIGANFPAAAEGIVCSESSSFNAIYFPNTTGVLEAGIWGVTGIVTSTTAVTKNAWNHVALVRNGNTFTMYVNGIGTSSTYSSSLSYTAFKVGVSPSVVYFNGYINDLRVTKGVARYTTNFTPPTSQLQDQ